MSWEHNVYLPWPDLDREWMQWATHKAAHELDGTQVELGPPREGSIQCFFHVPSALARRIQTTYGDPLENIDAFGAEPLAIEVSFSCDDSQPRRALTGRCSYRVRGGRSANGASPGTALEVMNALGRAFELEDSDADPAVQGGCPLSESATNPIEQLLREQDELGAPPTGWLARMAPDGNLDAALQRAWESTRDVAWMLDLACEWTPVSHVWRALDACLDLAVRAAAGRSEGTLQAFEAVQRAAGGQLAQEQLDLALDRMLGDDSAGDPLQLAVEDYAGYVTALLANPEAQSDLGRWTVRDPTSRCTEGLARVLLAGHREAWRADASADFVGVRTCRLEAMRRLAGVARLHIARPPTAWLLDAMH
jgi:hypothetical protein